MPYNLAIESLEVSHFFHCLNLSYLRGRGIEAVYYLCFADEDVELMRSWADEFTKLSSWNQSPCFLASKSVCVSLHCSTSVLQLLMREALKQWPGKGHFFGVQAESIQKQNVRVGQYTALCVRNLRCLSSTY